MNFILDLDNTLIYSIPFGDTWNFPDHIDYSYNFTVFQPSRNLSYVTKMYARPGLEQFLRELATMGTISIWTGAQNIYAEYAIKELFPKDITIKNVFTNYYTTKMLVKKKLLKPIKYLSMDYPEYSLANSIIIDDDFRVVEANTTNSILVAGFTKQSILSKILDNELDIVLEHIKNNQLYMKLKYT